MSSILKRSTTSLPSSLPYQLYSMSLVKIKDSAHFIAAKFCNANDGNPE
jgi:hypothetical protein